MVNSNAFLPSPQTTLLILLGASKWPLSQDFTGSKAFYNSYKALKDYFLDPQQFGIIPDNLLDLFDTDKGPDEIDLEIGRFLENHVSATQTSSKKPRDVLLYFVGHGGFVGRNADFYLAIRRTRTENPRVSGIQVASLADTLTEKARYLRRFIILDCCFAAAAFRSFESGGSYLAIAKALDTSGEADKKMKFPVKGVALLCSSDQKTPSIFLPDNSFTLFSKVLLDVLFNGNIDKPSDLSLYDVRDLTERMLSNLLINEVPKPVIYSPDPIKGDIATIAFFPNLAVRNSMSKQKYFSSSHFPAQQSKEMSYREEKGLSKPQTVSMPFMKAHLDLSLYNIEEKRKQLLKIGVCLGYQINNPVVVIPGSVIYILYKSGMIVDYRQRGTYAIREYIYQKWLDLGWNTKEILPVSDENICPDQVGYFNQFGAFDTGFRASIYSHPKTGTYSIQTAIREKWILLAWEGYYPTCDEQVCLDGLGRFNDFRRVDLDPTFYEFNDLSIYWHPILGAFEIHGAIRAYWKALGAEQYGYPISDELISHDGVGRFSKFHRRADDHEATIYWHPTIGVKEIL